MSRELITEADARIRAAGNALGQILDGGLALDAQNLNRLRLLLRQADLALVEAGESATPWPAGPVAR